MTHSGLARPETQHTAHDLLRGLLAPLPRKNCWTLSEHVGHPNPHSFQHLLSRARIDALGLINDLRDYVRTHLGEQDAVLILDETGGLKKGTETIGVQRQHTGTAGRIENAQVAVYLAYAPRPGTL